MTRARECGTKTPHPSKAMAESAKWHMVRTLGHRPSGLQVYKCPYCAKWHIGHKKRRRR